MVKFERDENGLIQGIDYVFTADGDVDWRKMLKPEHLVANKQKTQETDISKLQDNELLILLSGIRYLANLRGFRAVRYSQLAADKHYVCCACEIEWINNFETQDRIVTYSDVGDARAETTESFAQFYLGPIAANRAFVRCVRNFLKINILSKEEVAQGEAEVNNEPRKPRASTSPKGILEELMEQHKIDFSTIKSKFIKEGNEEAKNWNSIDDISNVIIFSIIERINAKNKKAKKMESPPPVSEPVTQENKE